MPWKSGQQFASRHNKKLKGPAAAHAARQANAMLRAGAPEGVAIATANKFANKMRRTGAISNAVAKKHGF
jgi:hypothetical protein